MNKLLTASLVAAAVLMQAQASETSTACPDFGFEAGLKAGWINHKTKVTVTPGSVLDIAKNQLTAVKKLADAYKAAENEGINASENKTELEKNEGVKALFAAVTDDIKIAQQAETINSESKDVDTQSANKSGVIVEPSIGYIHRANDFLIGGDFFFGFDSMKHDGLKRQWYVGANAKAGMMFTSKISGFLLFGAQLNKYKFDEVNASADRIELNKLNANCGAINEFQKAALEKEITAINSGAGTAEEKNAKISKATNLYGTEINITNPGIHKNSHSKNKFSPFIGAELRYAFTNQVSGTIGYKYQFSTKIFDEKTIDAFKTKDSSHTVLVGVAFNF